MHTIITITWLELDNAYNNLFIINKSNGVAFTQIAGSKLYQAQKRFQQ